MKRKCEKEDLHTHETTIVLKRRKVQVPTLAERVVDKPTTTSVLVWHGKDNGKACHLVDYSLELLGEIIISGKLSLYDFKSFKQTCTSLFQTLSKSVGAPSLWYDISKSILLSSIKTMGSRLYIEGYYMRRLIKNIVTKDQSSKETVIDVRETLSWTEKPLYSFWNLYQSLENVAYCPLEHPISTCTTCIVLFCQPPGKVTKKTLCPKCIQQLYPYCTACLKSFSLHQRRSITGQAAKCIPCSLGIIKHPKKATTERFSLPPRQVKTKPTSEKYCKCPLF